MLANVGIHWLADLLLAYFNQALMLWCAFGLDVLVSARWQCVRTTHWSVLLECTNGSMWFGTRRVTSSDDKSWNNLNASTTAVLKTETERTSNQSSSDRPLFFWLITAWCQLQSRKLSPAVPNPNPNGVISWHEQSGKVESEKNGSSEALGAHLEVLLFYRYSGLQKVSWYRYSY